jgi:hypothetical protein
MPELPRSLLHPFTCLSAGTSSTEFKHGCGIGLMENDDDLYFYLFDQAIKIMDIGIIILDFNSRIF